MNNFIDDGIICYHNSLNDLSFKNFTSSNLNVFYGICYFLKGIGDEKRVISLNDFMEKTNIKTLSTLKKGLEKSFKKFKEIDENIFLNFEINKENLILMLNPSYAYLFFPNYLYKRGDLDE